MRREKRSRKEIRRDLVRNYSSMESKVDSKAREVFKRKPYSVGTCSFLKIPRPRLKIPCPFL